MHLYVNFTWKIRPNFSFEYIIAFQFYSMAKLINLDQTEDHFWSCTTKLISFNVSYKNIDRKLFIILCNEAKDVKSVTTDKTTWHIYLLIQGRKGRQLQRQFLFEMSEKEQEKIYTYRGKYICTLNCLLIYVK